MNQHPGSVQGFIPASQAAVNSRSAFILRTYNHLFGAILLFVGLEVVYFKSGVAERIGAALLSVPWLLVLGGFMVVSWLASRLAHRSTSVGAQYAGLIGSVVVWSILFVPMLYYAEFYAPGTIARAAGITLVGFVALTAIAFISRKDFSFLRTVLMWGGFVALGLIVAGALFGFDLGTYFAVGMVGFAGAAILYDTSNVIHHFPVDRHVGAALELFASVALMFWYVLQILMGRR